MPARALYPGQETLEVKIRLPRTVVEGMDRRRKSTRSRTVATVLEEYIDRTHDQLQAIAVRQEYRDALKMTAQERNQALDELARVRRELKASRADLQSILRSVRMTYRNTPTSESHRLAGLMRRVRSYVIAVEEQDVGVAQQMHRIRSATPEAVL